MDSLGIYIAYLLELPTLCKLYFVPQIFRGQERIVSLMHATDLAEHDDFAILIKSETRKNVSTLCIDPRGVDNLEIHPVGHNFQPYTLPFRKNKGWWSLASGKDKKKRLAVIWGKREVDEECTYVSKEFYIKCCNSQGYRLNDVIIQDGPEDKTFR